LLDEGFDPIGLTESEMLLVPAKECVEYSSAGDELSKLSNLVQLARTGSAIFATVGRRSTALFIREGDGIEGVKEMQSIETANVPAIRRYLDYLKCVERG
jgi:hypothetical protein